MNTLLLNGIKEMGLDETRPGVEKMQAYLDKMLEKNKVLNLTAVSDPDEAVKLHLLDSMAIFTVLDLADKSVLDVGTGGGMPGTVIAAYEPTSRVTMLDSTAKKLNFIDNTCRELGIPAKTVNTRAEDFAKTAARESFDVVTARAVAALNVLCELCLPLVKVGGVFAAYKGSGAEEELKNAEHAIKVLGGEAETVSVKLPGVDAARTLILIKKVSKTPRDYPRAYAQIKKKPL